MSGGVAHGGVVVPIVGCEVMGSRGDEKAAAGLPWDLESWWSNSQTSTYTPKIVFHLNPATAHPCSILLNSQHRNIRP